MRKLLIEDADAYALKALAEGVASKGQQIRALKFFLNASGIRDMPCVYENPLEMAFDNGRKFVGWQVARLVELSGLTTAEPLTPKDPDV